MAACLIIVIALGATLLGICALLATCKPRKKWPPISYPLTDKESLALRKHIQRMRGS